MHIAIVMDGNGRWARKRNLPRAFGHRAGALRVEECVRVAPDLGINELTLYAFSTENWKRPAYEVSSIFRLLRVYFNRKAQELKAENVCVRFIGRRDRLSGPVQSTMKMIETMTAQCNRLRLNIAIEYGGQSELIDIVQRCTELGASGALVSSDIDVDLINRMSFLPESAPPDLMIRTGGERRLSNFLLWHIAYSELHFLDVLWPDFNSELLAEALQQLACRERRFGGLTEQLRTA